MFWSECVDVTWCYVWNLVMVTKAFLVLICCDDRCNLRPGRKPDQHAETGSKWLEDTFVLVTAQVSMAKSVTCGSPAVLQGDNMCLPALARSSSPVDKGKRIYGQGSQDVAASDWPGVTLVALEHVWNVDEALWHCAVYHADIMLISCWYIILYASSQEEEAAYFKTRPMPSSSILLRDHIQVLRAPPRCEYILTATGTSCTKLGGLAPDGTTNLTFDPVAKHAKLGILGVSQISDICIISVYSIHIFNSLIWFIYYSSSIHVLFMHYSWSKFCQKWRCSNGFPNSHVLPRGLTMASMTHWWCAYAAITYQFHLGCF